MPTTYEYRAVCDQCGETARTSGTIKDEAIELWQLPDGWFRRSDEESTLIFCSMDCLHQWTLENEGKDAAESLNDSVWIA